MSIANSILPQDIAVSDLSSSNMRANHLLRGDFAESSEGGFEVFGPSTCSRPVALARGRPERSESRNDDFLGQNVGIAKIVGLFETFVSEPEDVKAGLVAVETPA